MTKLIATLIGSGTSYGVPVPGSSLLIQKINENNKEENVNIIIDAGPDFRRQALKYNIDHINGIAVTHTHSDHIAGFDDVYSFAIRNKQIPVYSSLGCYGGMVERFGYIWEKEKRSEYLPWHEIKGNKQFEIEGIPITPIDVVHSVAQTHAFRIGDFVYMPDVKKVPKKSLHLFENVKTLLVDCTCKRKHSSHFNFDDSVKFVKKIGVEKAYLTHISHRLSYEFLQKNTTENIEPTFDGQQYTITLDN